MSITIKSLEIENVKRIKAVELTPSPTGLTVIGGKNGQGKTSVLDSIAWALGGERYRPSNATREGSTIPPTLKITMANGLVVERKGKNSDLKVTDPEGKRAGQQLLNEFVEQFALDLPKFMNASDKEKADTLLKIIGVGDTLFALERQETEKYNRRHTIGQIAEQKKKYAAEMVYYPDAPEEPLSINELLKSHQAILLKNEENKAKRRHRNELLAEKTHLIGRIETARQELSKLLALEEKVLADLEIAEKDVAELEDESTEEIERNIADIEMVNLKVRSNLDKSKAEEEAKDYVRQYDELTAEIDAVRKEKADLLNGADLPLPGLSVEDGELTYLGKKWDCMSGSEQLKCAVAIVRKLNPNCGFVLVDKLEQMDIDTLNEFGKWLEAEGLQAIATRVSTGDECSVIISDGYIQQPSTETPNTPWKAGQF